MEQSHPGVQARQQQQVTELCIGAIRALTGETEMHFRGRVLHRRHARVPVHAPHLYPAPEEGFEAFRGAADGLALRVAHSDLELHGRLAPDDPAERAVFEVLEQFRAESLAPPVLAGVVANLRHRHEQWSLSFHQSGLTETSAGILLYTVIQVCRAQVTGQPVVEETADLLESTRAGVAPLLGEHLAGLRRHRADQRAYAVHALAIARTVADLLDDAAVDGSDDAAPDPRRNLPLFVELEDDTHDSVATASWGHGRMVPADAETYHPFTTAYDAERRVSDLVRPAQLRVLRERLDRRVGAQGVNMGRLAHRIRELLAEPVPAGWDSGLEEGYVDGRRLAQLITSPAERRLFKAELAEPLPNCMVTFLVDCSGSMKEHAESVAMLVDVLGRAMEMAGVRTEILGFTTGAWNGGRAVRDWRRAGRPGHPGRLNELLHIVFKDADTPWRLARPGVAGLLRTELFREGVDGEAVEWACGRMVRRPEHRRLLVVLSDGSPMDSATHLANDEHYLDHHLRQVVLRQELEGSVAVYGLGLGLDLSAYYRHAQALDVSAGTPNSVFLEVLSLLAGARTSVGTGQTSSPR
jgi:cobaltochelatase CobT